MVVFIKEGDIFKIKNVNNYAHGCNCAGAMGKGIALQFKKKFPAMYIQYKHLCKSGSFLLGDVFAYNYGQGYVFNLATQTSWKTKADINAVEQSLKRMLMIATEKKISKISLPKIGAGLGGLDWLDIKQIIERLAIEYSSIELYVVEGFKSD